MKYKIQTIFRNKTNKAGEAYVDKKSGKPYERVVVIFEGSTDKVSFFDNGEHATLGRGSEIEGVIEKKDGWTNFLFAGTKAAEKNELLQRVEALEAAVFGRKDLTPPPETKKIEEVDYSDLPFDPA